jgi:MoaA/NifB/PqqE/SkfB family radical SAM enzyme
VAELLVLDGQKLGWHTDRLADWEAGKRIAPITIDMALTRKCDASCFFCYAMLQENEREEITVEHMEAFVEDSARMGVRGISLVSDGESLLSPAYARTIECAAESGISIASGTNGRTFTSEVLERVVPLLSYLRFNISAGTAPRYAAIMGFKEREFERTCNNVLEAARIKAETNSQVTIGIQMVLMPDMADQIIPFAQLAVDLGADYGVIKHCSDDEFGNLGVDYSAYEPLHPMLRQAEAMSTEKTAVVVKWSKIGDEGKRSYQKCFGPPFIIQVSGSGLVAPCGMLFNDRYAKFHIGNITRERWYDIWSSDRYWEVMGYLASDNFDAQRMCGSLCLQHMANTAINDHVQGTRKISPATGPKPLHLNFV